MPKPRRVTWQSQQRPQRSLSYGSDDSERDDTLLDIHEEPMFYLEGDGPGGATAVYTEDEGQFRYRQSQHVCLFGRMLCRFCSM